MGIFLFIGIAMILIYIDIRGLAALLELRLGWRWWLPIFGLVCTGFAIAQVSAMWPYSIGSNFKVYGIPMPIAILHRENGDWIDFVHDSATTFIIFWLNVLTLSAVLITPHCIVAWRRSRQIE